MTSFSHHPARVAGVIFLAALLPRLYALDTFLTIDEVKWAEGAAQFLMALHTGDLARTYWHFFPGITIAWGGALALWANCPAASDLASCTQSQIEHLPQFIGWLRLTPVLITSVGVAGVYLSGQKLLNHKIALLAALLLAFDPFFIAHSRILNGDAVTAILMFLSLLTFLLYWRKTALTPKIPPSSIFHPPSSILHPPSSILLSGALAGLALLTKLPAPFIGLFIVTLAGMALILDWPRAGWLAVRHWVTTLLLWGGIVLVVVFLGWPALWVTPAQTLHQMYADSFEVGEVGEGHDTFFVGQTLDDPGPWFYPYTVAFRLTPIVMIGLLVLAGWLILRFTLHASRFTLHASKTDFLNTELTTLWVIFSFVLLMIILAGLSPKKLDRYVMGVIPALIFLSAMGLARIGSGSGGAGERGSGGAGEQRSGGAEERGSRGAGEQRSRGAGEQRSGGAEEKRRRGEEAQEREGAKHLFRFIHPPSSIFLSCLVGLHLLSALLAAPYYLTYYNPLLGGPRRAVAQVPAGWGEGLEQAARYLNNLPEARSLTVSSWYGDIFQPYFIGQRASFADDGRAQLSADYVVFYVNQMQRQKPYAGLIDYFRATKPVFGVNIGPLGQVSGSDGTAWVEVYRAPAAQSASGAPKIEGVAQLLAYKVAGNRAAGSKDMQNLQLSNNEIGITLFLRVLGPMPEGCQFKVALISIQNLQSKIQNSSVWPPTQLKGAWLEGAVVEWPGTLTLPDAMPSGDYRLAVALQNKENSTLAEFAISEKDPAIRIEPSR